MKRPENYLLYVGNAYPHKNLERLIAAFKMLKADFADLKLILVGKKDFFYQRLEKSLTPAVKKGIIFYGFAEQKELADLYVHAQVFVFPSLMEGFGLPGLEAMAAGCPVVCSAIPALQEIYGPAALYFDPCDAKDIAEKIKMVLGDPSLKSKLKRSGLNQVKKYSWQKMAQQTLNVYRAALTL